MNRRQHERLKLQSSSMICSRSNEYLGISLIKDLSEGGMGFSTRNDFEPGSLIRIKFAIPEKSKKIVHGFGRIVWKEKNNDGTGDPLFIGGLKFHNIEPDCRKNLRHFIHNKAV